MSQNNTNEKAERPFVLSIGGFDPSGGAGVLADVKTFEACGVQGLAVVSANTIQTDCEFLSMHPVPFAEVTDQLKVLLKRFDPRVVKIGLVPDFNQLLDVLELLEGRTIVWDSVLKATAGFSFHENTDRKTIMNILQKVTVITPNWNEATKLFDLSGLSKNEIEEKLTSISQETECAILLKGGHMETTKASDFLFDGDRKFVFEGKRFGGYDKHGTGCMLSSAIAAGIAKGIELSEACGNAKIFVEERMLSNKSLLAYFTK